MVHCRYICSLIQIDRSQCLLHGPNLVEIPISFKLCEVDLLGVCFESGLRATPLLRVIVKITVKFPVCSEPKTHAYGDFDGEFDYDSPEWGCSKSASHKSARTRNCDQPDRVCRVLGPKT